jgi:hypothetical protein
MGFLEKFVKIGNVIAEVRQLTLLFLKSFPMLTTTCLQVHPYAKLG